MKPRYKDIAIISQNMALLYDDGINMPLIFELLIDLPLRKEYKYSLIKIQDDILKGKSISDSFARFSGLFPEFFIGMLKVGEKSGQFSKVLRNLEEYYSKIFNIRKKIISSLGYPLLLIISLVLVLISIIFFVIPSFLDVFASLGDKVPPTIGFLQLINDVIRSNPVVFTIAIISWFLIIPSLTYIFFIKNKVNKKIYLKLKIVREVLEYIFVLILSVIIDSGVSLTIGLNYAVESTKVDLVGNELRKMNEVILKGYDMVDSLQNSILLSKYTFSMIKLGERSGNLSTVISKIENKLEKDTNNKIDEILSLVQPSIVIAMGIMVGAFIAIFVLPLFDVMYSGIG